MRSQDRHRASRCQSHVGPLIPPAKRGGNRAPCGRAGNRQRAHVCFEYGMSVERAIPKDLPARSTVYDYLDLWSWDGTLDRIHHSLYVNCREAVCREASPTVAIIDSQSVKSAEKGGVRLIRPVMTQ